MIAIYGATGLAGELITRKLAERGATIAIAGRDRRRLEELAASLPTAAAVHVAHAHDPEALRTAFEGAKVVIGCAGPFGRIGGAILEAAIEARSHYVDISGEQPFLRDSFESYEAAAHRAGVVCISGLAFRIALGDWAATLAHSLLIDGKLEGKGSAGDIGEGAARGADATVDSISVAYAIRKPRLTARETASAAVALSSPTLVWKHDRWERMAPGAERKRFAFGEGFGEKEAVLFGGGEVITIPRHIAAREVKTYMWIETGNPLIWESTRLAPFLSPLLGPLVAGPLGRFVRAQAEAASPPSRELDHEHTEFAVVATATSGFEQTRVVIRGNDPYHLSAEICSAGALALAKRAPESGGVLTPAQVFDARARLYSLAARELIEVEES